MSVQIVPKKDHQAGLVAGVGAVPSLVTVVVPDLVLVNVPKHEMMHQGHKPRQRKRNVSVLRI